MTQPSLRILLALLAASAVVAAAGNVRAAEPQDDFFENQIRPLLAEHCVKCHGPDKQQAGIRLDLHSHVRGDEGLGPLVVPHQPKDSRIIQVVRYDEYDTQMPPSGKLSDEQIRLLEQWIGQGAYFPETSAAQTPAHLAVPLHNDGSIDFEAAAATHWAYQPIRRTPPPAINATQDAETDIDRYVIARLEGQGLSLSPPASTETLVRRLYADLLGVPPTFEQVQEFVEDDSPDAYARLVDRLLASPLYGQRWGRYWLDIARYADTLGYLPAGRNTEYPFAYTYRDYVVDAFNSDKPYDQFVTEQLAADLIESDDPKSLAALGFLTVGNEFLGRQDNIIADQIDVVTQGLLGMTVGCARCHDHKYDPIPTADYYSLYGVLASTSVPEELPVIATPEDSPGYRAYLAERSKREAALEDYQHQTYLELLEDTRSRMGDYLINVLAREGRIPENPRPPFAATPEPRRNITELWNLWITRTDQEHSVFRLWHELTALPDEGFAQAANDLLKSYRSDSDKRDAVNPLVLDALTEQPPQNVIDVARTLGDLISQAHHRWQSHVGEHASQDAPPEQLSEPEWEELRLVLYGELTPGSLPEKFRDRIFERDHVNQIRRLTTQLAQLDVSNPYAPPRAMVVQEAPKPVEPHIFIRGNASQRGERVPRRAPQILVGVEGNVPFEQGSGRRQLAEIITSPDNPLTARVIANRIWMSHIGSPLVGTPNDFGSRSDPPTHPQLLDYLAGELMDSGWSLKHLHRQILLSATYRQASADRPDCRAVDPENVLLWRMNRRRLDFESMRDSMLAAAGALDPDVGGRPFQLEDRPYIGRRTIYGRINRNDLPAIFRTFDFPSPDATSPMRPETTVPQQALFAMNAPFVHWLADQVARDADVQGAANAAMRVEQVYRNVLSRDSTASERTRAIDFLKSARESSQPSPSPVAQLAHVLLMSNEFLFVD